MRTVGPAGCAGAVMRTVGPAGCAGAVMRTVGPAGSAGTVMRAVRSAGIAGTVMRTVGSAGIAGAVMRTVGSAGCAGTVMRTGRFAGMTPAFAAGMPSGPPRVPDIAARSALMPAGMVDRLMAPGAVPPGVIRMKSGTDVKRESEPDSGADIAAVTINAPGIIGAPSRIPPRVVVGVRRVIRNVRAVPGSVIPDVGIEHSPARDARAINRVILADHAAAVELGSPRVPIDGDFLFGEGFGKLFQSGRLVRGNVFGGRAVFGGVRRLDRGEFFFLFLFNDLLGRRLQELFLERMISEPVDLTGRRIEHRGDQTQIA